VIFSLKFRNASYLQYEIKTKISDSSAVESSGRPIQKVSTLKVEELLDESYAAFTLNGLDDQERNLTFVKTGFQVLKLKFHACNFKQAFYSLLELYIA